MRVTLAFLRLAMALGQLMLTAVGLRTLLGPPLWANILTVCALLLVMEAMNRAIESGAVKGDGRRWSR